MATTNPVLHPNVEAAQLRELIEKQPFCLMRVGMDGLVLAANDAALGLLGARELRQVLGSPLTAWLAAGSEDRWREFAATLASGSPSSVECELTDLSRHHRTVLFRGVPLLNHADGTPSMILGASDVSVPRRIETALEAGESDPPQPAPQQNEQIESQRAALERLERLLRDGRTHLQKLRTQLQQTVAERDALAQGQRLLAEQHARDLTVKDQEFEQRVNDLRTQLDAGSMQHEIELSRKEHEAQRRTHDLHAQLEAASAERQRLATRLEEAESAHQRQMADQATEAQQRTHDLQAQLEAASAEQRKLATRLEEAESVHQRQMADQAADTQQRTHDLHTQLDAALAEQSRLAGQHELDLLLNEQEAQQRADDLRTQLVTAEAERARLKTLLEDAENVHRDFQAEVSAERSECDRVLETAALRQKEMAKELADLRVELRSMDLGMRQLAPLAASGRLALEVGQEVSKVAESIEARAARLLEQCPLDSPSRGEIEALRSEAMQARSLSSQILQASLREEHP